AMDALFVPGDGIIGNSRLIHSSVIAQMARQTTIRFTLPVKRRLRFFERDDVMTPMAIDARRRFFNSLQISGMVSRIPKSRQRLPVAITACFGYFTAAGGRCRIAG
ncbi:MAG TPA: hypothetical protein VLL97_13640, partial [Acidobacteriota bacterium]|nr:hypothetical protein [Acidobacteriota bacterium]